jgi:hypothetical protein
MSLYSTVDSDMLCRKCQHGSIREGNQGQTVVLCAAGAYGDGAQPQPMHFVVTKCTDYRDKEAIKLWAKVPEMRVTDGQLEVKAWHKDKMQWIPAHEAIALGLI